MFSEKRLGSVSCFVFEELDAIPGLVHAFTSRLSDTFLKDAEGWGELTSGKKYLLKKLGIQEKQLVFLRQIHSDRVILLSEPELRSSQPLEVGPADGVIARHPGQFPVIQTADCLPVIAVDPERKQVCAIHAGWRGTRNRIVQKGISRFLEKIGSEGEDLLVGIGPGIRHCCYEVGAEVWQQFREADHDIERCFAGGYLDLVEANKAQLETLGVGQVFDSGLCTCCRADLFYSYRREKQRERMWALAGFLA